jgi:serine/threonine protein kinase
MEYCGAGSVCDLMAICEKTLSEEQIGAIMKMALHGLDYLHKCKKIHRDIKSGNLLLNHEGDCKLADFGVSAELTTTLSKRKTVIGTPYVLLHACVCACVVVARKTLARFSTSSSSSVSLTPRRHHTHTRTRFTKRHLVPLARTDYRTKLSRYWMAPEVLQSAEYDGKADIWSLAITAIELAVGQPPHTDVHPMRAIFLIPTSPPPTLPNPSAFSPAFNDFLKACLQKHPDRRPTAAQLLQHPFIKGPKGKQVCCVRSVS